MNTPVILGFDSSAAHCGAALLVGDEIVTTRLEPMARGQAERLIGLCEDILTESGRSWPELTAIGVGIGPGNFTGIRISVAAARGLSLGLGVPAIGVSTLEAGVHGLPRPVLSGVDARRGARYEQLFTSEGATSPCLIETPTSEAVTGAAHQLAPAIARITAERLTEGSAPSRPAPLYIRAADAAPPRDPAPVILDG